MPKKKQSIVIIGAGNVATHLATAFKAANYTILQVYSRTEKNAIALAKKVNATYTNNIKHLSKDADMYIVALTDDAARMIVKKINVENKILLHTSGSLPMDMLNTSALNIGVIYPLQTLSKGKKVDVSTIPFCIEANNTKTLATLKQLTNAISKNVSVIDTKQRLALHVAAVFACNFTNHFYAIASDILKQHKINFKLIQPLIAETAEKIKYASPAEMQTGPAIRGDKKTIEAHLNFLKNEKYKTLYKIISKSIVAK